MCPEQIRREPSRASCASGLLLNRYRRRDLHLNLAGGKQAGENRYSASLLALALLRHLRIFLGTFRRLASRESGRLRIGRPELLVLVVQQRVNGQPYLIPLDE